jgi:hypothetical protein
MVFGCCVCVGGIDIVQMGQRVFVAQIDSSVKRHTNLLCEVHKQGLWNPDGARLCPRAQTGPGANAASSTTVTSLFPGGIAAQTCRRQPAPPIAKVKARVELHDYFPSGPTRAALG